MTIRRASVVWSLCGAMLLATCGVSSAAEEEAPALFAYTDIEPAAPSTAAPIEQPALPASRAAKRSRYKEKPWKPYVCAGCELNNRPSPDQ